ncbi:hypothetical protein [Paractinoplanes rishiriensis]|uniref:Uncharacterized protein n=1 Tax=Paractinoplanes rishiriensis TaxID=1050105 RepID=A0A919N2C3_9ACTN|nr:hypothetical protein [Actinoplanes rishiriensis]GIE99382.1 hypothetical protein Ari01nite_68470 [Actinoplanes rishiriensis]
MHLFRDLEPARDRAAAFRSGNGTTAILVHGDPVAERVIIEPHGPVVTIDRPGAAATGHGGNYCRLVDFTTAEVSAWWGGLPRHRAFVSRADGVVVQQINGGPAEVGVAGCTPYGQAGLILIGGLTVVAGDAAVTGERVTVRSDALVLTGPGDLVALARHSYTDLLLRHVARHAPAYLGTTQDRDGYQRTINPAGHAASGPRAGR